MATIFIDGFDKYGPTGTQSISTGGTNNATNLDTLLTQGEWTSTTSNDAGGGLAYIQIVAGLSATGGALKAVAGSAGSGGQVKKTLPGNYSRIIGGFRFNSVTAAASQGVQFDDATSHQFSVTINAVGTISIKTGDRNGTAIATSVASVSSGSTHFLEWDVTIGTSAAYNVYLDGVSVVSGSGNTRGGTSTSQVNGITLTCALGNGGSITFDDLYLFDTTTSFNNAVLLTSPRIETRFPSSDSQTQWTNIAALLGTNYSITNSTNAPGANQLFLRKYTCEVSQTLNSVSCVPEATSASAKFKAVIYPDSGNSPNGQALIATGGEVTGTTSGTTLTSTFGSPPSLTASTAYWIGFITDTSVVLQETDTTTTGVSAANTYGSGAPGTCPTVTTLKNSWNIYGNCTGAATNWESVDDNPVPGDGSSITSATPGNEDLYGFPALTTTASNIYTVAVKANMKRSDTGPRTIDLRVKSNTTDSGGTNTGQTPPTSYTWMDSYFDTDPDTGAVWGAAAVNAATAGVKVAS